MMLLTAALSLLAAPAIAHHGWSSFDQDKPVYLEGKVKSVRWGNPHAEAVIEVTAGMTVPADLPGRTVPAQTQRVDGAAVLSKARAPAAPAGEWELEFAPLHRMQAWGLTEPPKIGDRIEVIGYTAPDIGKGRLMRVEYLFINGKAHGLRSSPAN
jgi:hypothetical protein